MRHIAAVLALVVSAGTVRAAAWDELISEAGQASVRVDAPAFAEEYDRRALELLIKRGTYTGPGEFKITVRPDPIFSFLDEVRADGVVDGRVQSALFNVDPARKIPILMNLGRGAEMFELNGYREEAGVGYYSFAAGGSFDPVERRMTIGVRISTGELFSLASKTKIVRFSLPNGKHSGPWKEVFDDFSVSGLVRVDE